jgi:hypothetical protein
MEQSFANLIFEGLVSPFKISNMVWFCHDISRIHGCYCLKKERTPSAVWGTTKSVPRFAHRRNRSSSRNKPLQPTGQATLETAEAVFDLDQTAALPFFCVLPEGLSHGA